MSARLFTNNIYTPFLSTLYGSSLNIANWNNTANLNLTFFGTDTGNTFNYYMDNLRQNFLFGQTAGNSIISGGNSSNIPTADMNIARNLAISTNALTYLNSTITGSSLVTTDNTAIGFNAAKNLDFGHNNTVVGSYAMSNIGSQLLGGASASSLNILPFNLKFDAGGRDDITSQNNITSSYNTVVGYNSMNGQYIQGRSISNTVLGANAFTYFTTPDSTYRVYTQNTFLGFNAQPISGVYSNQIVLGTVSETTYLPGMLNVTFDASFGSRLSVLFDVSFNKRLFVGGDASLNTRLTVGGDVSFNRTFQVIGQSVLNGDVSMNARLFVSGDASLNSRVFITSDLSLGGRMFVNADASFNNRLYVASDVSFGRNFQVFGQSVLNSDVSMNARLFVNGDASFNSRAFITSDLSLGGRLFVNADVSFNNRLYVASDVSFNKNFQVFGQSILNGDVSLNNRLFVGQDVTIYGRLSVNNYTSTSIINTTTTNYSMVIAEDLSINNRLFVGQDASFSMRVFVAGDLSLNSRLFVFGDASMNSRLFVANDVSFNQNLQVFGKSLFQNDVSINTNLQVLNNLTVEKGFKLGGDFSMPGRLFLTNDVSFNNNLYVGQKAIYAGDLSANSRLFIGNDASLNGKLFVNGDVSMNSRLFVYNDVSMNGKLFVRGDVSMNGSVSIRDATITSRLFTTNISLQTNNNIFSINALTGNTSFNTNNTINIPNFNIYFSTKNTSTGNANNNLDLFVDNPRSNLIFGQNSSSPLYNLYAPNPITGLNPDFTSQNFIQNLAISSNALTSIGSTLSSGYASTDNIAIGFNSITYMPDGRCNTALGSHAMTNLGIYPSYYSGTNYSTSSIKKTPIYSFDSTSDGYTSNFNTAIGYFSMASANINTTSSKNTALGSFAFSDVDQTGSNPFNLAGIYTQNTIIGYNAQPIRGIFSNQIVLGTSTETTYIPGLFQVIRDASINGRLCVNSDLSLNGRFFFNSNAFPINSIPYNSIANLATSVNALVTSGIATISSASASATVTALTIPLDAQYSFGTSWKQVGNTAYQWYDVAMSMTGEYQTALEYPGWIWYSNDFGVTWIKSNIFNGSAYSTTPVPGSYNYNGTSYATTGNYNWTAIAVSYSGQYQIAAVDESPQTPYSILYLSSDYGISWAETFENYLAPGSAINALAISSNGQYQYASVYGYYFLSSSSYGTNWYAPTISNNLANGYWQAIATSSNGQYVCFGGYQTSIFTSANYGATILAAPGAPTASWVSISISYSGQYIVAAPGGYTPNAQLPKNSSSNATPKSGFLYFSSNFGSNFYPVAINTVWTAVRISGNGQYTIATSQSSVTQGQPGPIWYSYNYGFTWVPNSSISRYWVGCAISSTGQFVTIVSPNNNVFTSITGLRNQTISNLFETNNMNVTGNLSVTGISNPIKLIDGSVLSTGALSLDYNNNFGTYWTTSTFAASTNSGSYFNNISMSLTGQFQSAVTHNYIYISNNYGVNWSTTYGNTSLYLSDIFVSASGQFQFACANPGYVYSSSNYGINWATCYSTSYTWTTIKGSYSGQYVAFAGTLSKLYFSSNFGNSFSVMGTIDIASSSTKSWQSICVSSSGQYISVAAVGEFIYTSANYGINWSPASITTAITNGGKYWQSLSSSANGQYVYAAAGNNNAFVNSVATIVTDTIYISTNFGYSFSQSSSTSTLWQFISTSSSGQCVLAVTQTNTLSPASTANPGYIYSSADFGKTWIIKSTTYSATFNGCYVSSTAQYLATCSTAGLNISTTPYSNFSISNTLTVGTGTNQINLYGGNGQVSAVSFNATSDQRVKTNIFEINTSMALDTLRKLEPVSFEYIDKTACPTPTWGFIAQEIEKVLDYSVSKNKNYIPNIYEQVSIQHNIITLNNKFTSDLSLCDTPIQIQLRDANNSSINRFIDKIIDLKSFSITEPIDPSIDRLFFYGQQVDDYLSVNKDSIFTITTAAAQQLDKELQEAKQTIRYQSETIQSLQSDVSILKAQVAFLIDRLDNASIP